MSRTTAPAALVAALLLPLSAAGQRPDWDALADVETLEVLTRDEDGEPRETKIWLAVVDGQGFIRTGSSRWGEDVARDPDVVLRIGGGEYPLRADFIEDEALRERVAAAFREKYGFQDRMVGWFRFGDTRIMHLRPRPPGASP